jgi:hypothetical protein
MKSFLTTAAFASLLGLLPAAAQAQDARDQFATLKSLCGQQFDGVLVYPKDPQHDFAGKRLQADFACSDRQIKQCVPVGEDVAHLIISRTPTGLALQHDHRHADGTPDAVTMYGGMASTTGSALSQSFLADDYTARLVKGPPRMWTISVSADGTTLTYHLERDAQPRATVVFKPQRRFKLSAPPAPSTPGQCANQPSSSSCAMKAAISACPPAGGGQQGVEAGDGRGMGVPAPLAMPTRKSPAQSGKVLIRRGSSCSRAAQYACSKRQAARLAVW